MSFADLDTRGFVVVRGFLGPDDLALLSQDFRRGAPPERFPYGFKLIGRAALARMGELVLPALERIRAETALRVDIISVLGMSHYITTERVERTAHWHQDFDLDYRLSGDHIDSLNFWIPFEKPDSAGANVRVVPWDTLQARAPEAHAALVGGGGYRLAVHDGHTEVRAEDGSVRRYAVDLEAIAETPALAAGDLLLLRGDTIHRTQDADTVRVAASVRATASTKPLLRSRLGARDPHDPAAALLDTIHECFDAKGGDAIALGDYLRFVAG